MGQPALRIQRPLTTVQLLGLVSSRGHASLRLVALRGSADSGYLQGRDPCSECRASHSTPRPRSRTDHTCRSACGHRMPGCPHRERRSSRTIRRRIAFQALAPYLSLASQIHKSFVAPWGNSHRKTSSYLLTEADPRIHLGVAEVSSGCRTSFEAQLTARLEELTD